MDNTFIFDIEANNLYPFQDKVWTIIFKKFGTDQWLRLNPFKDNVDVKQAILDFVFQEDNPTIVAHNGLGYDSWVLWKEFGMEFTVGKDTLCGREVTYFDTFYASQYLLPDREGGHSLKAWGKKVGDEKIDYRQLLISLGALDKKAKKGDEFKFYHPEMDNYCEQDVMVTEQVYKGLYQVLLNHDTFKGFKLGQKSFYLMAAQGFTGISFDETKAKQLEAHIREEMTLIKELVEPQLPERKLKKTEESRYTFPSKPFKADGTPSSHMENFLKRNDAVLYPNDTVGAYGRVFKIVPKEVLDIRKPITLDDQVNLKEYLIGEGWKPTMWNYKKDKNKRFIRDNNGKLIKTSPKLQEDGTICPNLLELNTGIIKDVVKYLSYKNRLSTLRGKQKGKGWLVNPRLKFDGRLSAGASGIASTHRQKHTCVVNVPKAQEGVLLGKEFRSLFKVEEGFKLIGCDQAALEARVQGHWTYRYDDGKAADELVNGDVHSKNAKAFYSSELEDYNIHSSDFNKDEVGFKPFRSKSKNGYYAIIYGCSAQKLGSTLGKSVKEGKRLLEIFWEANPSLKELKDNLEAFWMSEGNRKYVPTIDKRRLYSRSQHSLVNLLFQSTGAIIVDYALCLFDVKMGGLLLDELGRPYYKYKGYTVKRVIYSHDEYQVEAERGIAKEVAEIMEWTMTEAGVRLNIKVPLVGEATIGDNWRETH